MSALVAVKVTRRGLSSLDFRVLLDGEEVGLGSVDRDGVGGSGDWIESEGRSWSRVSAIVETLAAALLVEPFAEVTRLEAAVSVDPEECPGCGNKPGDGVSKWCSHPLGCGHWKSLRGS